MRDGKMYSKFKEMYPKNTLRLVSEYLLLWDRPLTLRDRSHVLGPGHGEYISSG